MSRRTSELGYYVRERSREVSGLRPTAAGPSRWTVNNLNHVEDEALQTLANITADAGLNYTQATTTPGTYALLDNMSPIPVMLHRQDDGSSSRLVCTLRGYCSAGGHTASFILMLRPFSLSASLFSPITGVATSASVSFASTVSSESIATVYVEQLASSWVLGDPLPLGLNAAGAPTSVRMYAGQLELWATTDDATAHPVMESLTVREWVG